MTYSISLIYSNKRREPLSGLTEISSYRSKRSKTSDIDWEEWEDVQEYNRSLENRSEAFTIVPARTTNRWSLTRILSRSKIYQWLMGGLKTAKALVPGLLMALSYNTLKSWTLVSGNLNNSFEGNDKVLQAILSKHNMNLSGKISCLNMKKFISI